MREARVEVARHEIEEDFDLSSRRDYLFITLGGLSSLSHECRSARFKVFSYPHLRLCRNVFFLDPSAKLAKSKSDLIYAVFYTLLHQHQFHSDPEKLFKVGLPSNSIFVFSQTTLLLLPSRKSPLI